MGMARLEGNGGMNLKGAIECNRVPDAPTVSERTQKGATECFRFKISKESNR